tara:strand:+ start:422 stop:730 length:309 start_codon:yes stop_codon:yes gene_type:complete
MKYLISFILLVFISFNVKAESFDDLTFTQFNIGHPVLCISSKDLKPTLKNENKIFTGMLNSSAIIETYLDKDQTFLIVVHSVSKLSCIYFMGKMGTLNSLTN